MTATYQDDNVIVWSSTWDSNKNVQVKMSCQDENVVMDVDLYTLIRLDSPPLGSGASFHHCHHTVLAKAHLKMHIRTDQTVFNPVLFSVWESILSFHLTDTFPTVLAQHNCPPSRVLGLAWAVTLKSLQGYFIKGTGFGSNCLLQDTLSLDSGPALWG